MTESTNSVHRLIRVAAGLRPRSVHRRGPRQGLDGPGQAARHAPGRCSPERPRRVRPGPGAARRVARTSSGRRCAPCPPARCLRAGSGSSRTSCVLSFSVVGPPVRRRYGRVHFRQLGRCQVGVAFEQCEQGLLQDCRVVGRQCFGHAVFLAPDGVRCWRSRRSPSMALSRRRGSPATVPAPDDRTRSGHRARGGAARCRNRTCGSGGRVGESVRPARRRCLGLGVELW